MIALASAAVRRASFRLGLLAVTVLSLLSSEHRAHAAEAPSRSEASSVESDDGEKAPPSLRWGLALAGGVGGGMVGMAGGGGYGGGLQGELGGAISNRFSIYWAPQVYMFAAQAQSFLLLQQNAAIFEWTPGENFALGGGPSLDFMSFGGTTMMLPTPGLELRTSVTFGERNDEPRFFAGVTAHMSALPYLEVSVSLMGSIGVRAF